MGRIAAWVVVGALLAGAVGQAQTQSASAPESSVGVVLRNLASRAGVAFVGQVERIDRTPGVVTVVFQVQQRVLGAVGATYELREWGGLWTGGQQRFRLGQRAMIFLHTPGGTASGAGLSSPVDGMEGVVPVVVQGADAPALLDVRWLAARVERPVGAPIADAQDGAILLSDGVAVAANWNKSQWTEPTPRPLPAGVVSAQTPKRLLPVNVNPAVPVAEPAVPVAGPALPVVQAPLPGVRQGQVTLGTVLTAPSGGADGSR